MLSDPRKRKLKKGLISGTSSAVENHDDSLFCKTLTHYERQKFMRLLICLLLGIGIVGCGAFKRSVSSLTGEPSEYCYVGVRYLQFPSGAVVAVDSSGKPLPCK